METELIFCKATLECRPWICVTTPSRFTNAAEPIVPYVPPIIEVPALLISTDEIFPAAGNSPVSGVTLAG